MSDSIPAQVAALPGKSIAELKDLWRELYQAEPPPYNRGFLVKRLAYRIQELAYGGLSARTVARLDALADEEEARVQGKPRRRITDRPVAGTLASTRPSSIERPGTRSTPSSRATVYKLRHSPGATPTSGAGG